MSQVKSGMVRGIMRKILTSLLVGSILLATALAQSAQGKGTPTTTPTPAPSPIYKKSRYHATGVPPHAKDYYQIRWGVDSLSTKAVESGLMIRFNYRVVDPQKAKVLNDKKSSPFLLDDRSHVKLVVPTMEKIGELRQSAAPEGGKMYWMVFSNRERFVKPGDRVSVVIGKFRADDLLVQ